MLQPVLYRYRGISHGYVRDIANLNIQVQLFFFKSITYSNGEKNQPLKKKVLEILGIRFYSFCTNHVISELVLLLNKLSDRRFELKIFYFTCTASYKKSVTLASCQLYNHCTKIFDQIM